ncbi:MAG: rod shape-determining protein RodA [Candidatus Cloacimonadota bacterium]|nr:MAG: rod shape-determining protein RodA [Candidatus Cloacimonadota bacterium]
MFGKKIDIWFIVLWIALVLYGVVAVYSASYSKAGDDLPHVKTFYIKQIIFVLFSALAVFIVYRIPYPVIDALIMPSYVISCLFLFAVIFSPAINGSHRWLVFGPVSMQPSEFAKLSTILFAAKILSDSHLSEFKIILRSFSVFALPVLLILAEPDLGMSVTMMVIALGIMIAAGLPLFYVVILISPLLSIFLSFNGWLFLIYASFLFFYLFKKRLSYLLIYVSCLFNVFIFFLTPVFWNNLKSYQQKRILTFLDPRLDPLGAGYQVIQAKISIGSGMFWGKGLLNGTQKNLEFLPENHTDFIFSVIGEEAGFVGASVLIILFFLFLQRVLVKISDFKVREYKIASYGIVTYIVFQIFINIGMNTGLVPTTGIALPFISYGGSNLLVNSIAFAMFLKYCSQKSLLR